MPHIPHFRRDVELSKTSPTSSNTESDKSASNMQSEQKHSKLMQKTRLLLPFLFGGVASCVAEAATFPIDTAKTRLQLQGQAKDKRHSSTPYRGMLHCWKTVATEEGVKVLYSGIAPALLRQAVYGTMKYGLYYSLKDLVSGRIDGGEESPITNVSLAVVSGAISSAVANPTDVLKVRMQSGTADSITKSTTSHAGHQFNRMKMSSAFKDIYIKEGIGGLWRGVCPTAQRAAIVAGVQLPVYDLTKVFLIRHDLLKESPINNLISSIFAGLCACLVSSPMDVIRTRMMDQRKLRKAYSLATPNSHTNPKSHVPDTSKRISVVADKSKVCNSSPKSGPVPVSSSASNRTQGGRGASSQPIAIYKSTFECGLATVRNEGFNALYRGFVPAFMRMGPWNIIFFLVYEQLKQI